jgi:hypothetical protein
MSFRGVGAVAFPDGDVFHEAAFGGAAPVFFSGRAGYCLAGLGFGDDAVAGADEGYSGDDVQCLVEHMVVPVGAGSGAKRTMFARTCEGSVPDRDAHPAACSGDEPDLGRISHVARFPFGVICGGS